MYGAGNACYRRAAWEPSNFMNGVLDRHSTSATLALLTSGVTVDTQLVVVCRVLAEVVYDTMEPHLRTGESCSLSG